MTRGLLLTRSVPDVGKVIALDCRVRMRSMRQIAPFPRLKGSPAARWRWRRVQGRGWRVTGRVRRVSHIVTDCRTANRGYRWGRGGEGVGGGGEGVGGGGKEWEGTIRGGVRMCGPVQPSSPPPPDSGGLSPSPHHAPQNTDSRIHTHSARNGFCVWFHTAQISEGN